MLSERLKGYRVAILATDLFEEVELTEPRKALDEAGATTVVIAPHAGEIQAVHHGRKTLRVKVDQTLAEADPQKFNAVLIPGGRMNAEALRQELLAQDFVRNINQRRLPIAVICHGPLLLISAHIVKGRHMTSYKAIQEDLRSAGAYWQDSEIVRDRNWLSSRQPSDIPRFNQEMVNLFIDNQANTYIAA
jgi:protease I